VAVAVGQVPTDRVGAGLQTLLGQLLAEPHDQGDQGRVQGGRRARGPSGPWLKCGVAFGQVPGFELVGPGSVDPVAGGYFGGLVVDEESGDDQAGLRGRLWHGRASGPVQVSPMS
jgi:hypothetical protein